MRGTLQSREGPARRDWPQLGPSTDSILPLGRRAGSHRAAGTCSSVIDQAMLGSSPSPLRSAPWQNAHWIVLPDPPFTTRSAAPAIAICASCCEVTPVLDGSEPTPEPEPRPTPIWGATK